MKFGTLKQCLYYPYFIANNKLHPFIKWQCVHCSTRNTIEKLYNSNQNLASHLLCQAHSEMFKKLRNSHLNFGDR